MERLTKSGAISGKDINELLDESNENQMCKTKAYYKLQEYEDLEEQGRLVKLPCKIGTEVYDITWWDNVQEKVVIKGKAYHRTVYKHKVTKLPFTYSDIDNFGKTVFLTKSEAKQKLKEMESD